MLVKVHELVVFQAAELANANDGNPLAGAQDDDIVVRGIIDGYVIDDEHKSIILFDYKTDRLRQDESTDEWAVRLADDYRQQQDLYARALEQRHPGYQVTQRWLVGLAGHRLIDVNPKL